MITGTRYRLAVEINRQSELARAIARVQAEISSQKRILAPSDDPTAAARVAELARTQADEAAWMRNLDIAGALADRADNALASVEVNVHRANELILAASTGSLSADNRATIADELRGIAIDIATLAQTRDPLGNALFRTGSSLEIPVHAGGTVAPVATRDEIFDNVTTPAGVQDLVSIINDAADAVIEPNATLRQAATQASIDAIGAASNHIASVRGDQGVRANRIAKLSEQFQESSIQLTEQRSALEDVDIVEAVARLQAKQVSLEAAQAVFARVNQSTLFDLLR
jgi:flagellar hook-associated protein 3 FlgL